MAIRYGTLSGVSGVDDKNMFGKMMAYDRLELKSYLQFKYYGDFDTLSYIKNDIEDDMLYVGNSHVDGSPVFRYYVENEEMIKLIKQGDIKAINLYLRLTKLKVVSCDVNITKKEKSLYTFFRFFLNANDRHLVKHTAYGEINNTNEYFNNLK